MTMIIIIATIALIFESVYAGQDVPNDLRLKLKAASTFHDFMKTAKVQLKQKAPDRARIKISSFSAMASTKRGPSRSSQLITCNF